MGIAALLAVSGGSEACNSYSFTMATPLNPLQAGVQRVVAGAVKSQTGLAIIVAESVDSEQHLQHYLRGKSDLIVISGEEPKAFLDAVANLPGKQVVGKGSGITIVIHPETMKLFPKMGDLVSKLMVVIDAAGRERLASVTSDAAAKKLLEGR
jgi:hypothetical protein